MTFQQSVKTCLISKYLFVFRGRASRSEFWWFMLFIGLVNLVCALIFSLLPLAIESALNFAVSLCLLPANLGVTARRLHDRNMSAWWMLLPILALLFWLIGGAQARANTLNSIVSFGMCLLYLIILCMPGQSGPNRFGPDPLEK